MTSLIDEHINIISDKRMVELKKDVNYCVAIVVS